MLNLWIESHTRTMRHRKIHRLACSALLSKTPAHLREYAALGIVHALWYFTMEQASDGDLSSFTLQEITRGCEWTDDAGALVDELVRVGFIDKADNGTLSVHDWEQYVAAELQRKERKRMYMRERRAQMRDAANPFDTTERRSPEDEFADWYKAYPRHDGKAAALKAWLKLTRSDDLPPLHEMLATLERQKRSPRWTKDKGEYVPMPASYLNGKRWEDKGVDTLASPARNAHSLSEALAAAEFDGSKR